MANSSIQDIATRNAINDIERRLNKINNIPQIPSTATLGEVIDILNKIIAKDKRK